VEDKPKANQYPPPFGVRELRPVRSHFVPPDATIAELEKKAAECKQKAEKSEVPLAAELRQEAKLCREWIAALRSGRWTA
jgi:hypothetical protein